MPTTSQRGIREQEQAQLHRNARKESIVEIITALQNVKSSSYWKTIEERVLGGVAGAIQSRLATETDEKEIYRLQGQMVWASKFMDLGKLAEVYKKELEIISNNGKNSDN